MSDIQQTEALTIEAKIDRRAFFRFAVFDTLIRKKGWRNPALFTLILSAFALICFLGCKTHAQAGLIGGVLLGGGLVLPLVWLGMFFASVSRQAKRSGLSADKAQYVVTLSPEKLHVEKGEEKADFAWGEVYMAYRVRGCIYLYVSPARAFLLPDCADTDRAWALIASKLDAAKLQDRSR